MPDISPARGEIGCHHWLRQLPRLQNWQGRQAADLPPAGEMSGRTEGGAKELGLTAIDPIDAAGAP
ncbi:hypothetical protein EJ070_05800 [Mesorhizobium sp. M1E.F.Ca.ET.045.02.1.1]|nr:hypothetical protein EJ070_05800 [Mesorhizobium sp. M1E.F.Ca.ET.045.02.1.1]